MTADARARQLILTKPPGSLGRLEDIAVRLCELRHTLSPSLARKRVLVFAADHGVAMHDSVSPYPSSVTAQMAANFGAGGAAICAICRQVDAQLTVIDVGIAEPLSEKARSIVVNARVANGTRHIAHDVAMTIEQCEAALDVGADVAEATIKDGVDVLALGEMGIGNTTIASALTAALCALPPTNVVGPGTGADEAMRARKVDVIERAMTLHHDALASPLDTLAALGGFELAATAGAVLAAAAYGIPVVVDGFISTAGAAMACELSPCARSVLFASHRSSEPGHSALLNHLEIAPLLSLGMRLGEGTGAALALPILASAAATMSEMATFSSASVDNRKPD